MIVLGSTGSIGINTLLIAQRFHLNIDVLVVGYNIDLLNNQIKTHKPSIVVIADKKDQHKVDHNNIYIGQNGILRAIEESSSTLVVNALVGLSGLKPTLKTLELNKKLALANKESLVVAGAFIDSSKITPIDSEHFGLWYLYQNRNIEQMQITASGGAFRDWSLQKIQTATLKDALKHPNWDMGTKITIDSASMTNKLFELLEAKWLFPNVKKFDAFIETKSIIHALIDYQDGSTTAHFANANMQLPIAYAILDKIEEPILERVDFLKIKTLEFKEITSDRYPIWELKNTLLKNPSLGTILNSANEETIKLFIKEKIGFLDISYFNIKAIQKFQNQLPTSFEDIFSLDIEVKKYINTLI
jgi:1-deoxy-D-xylulose-5-phosphate reductoisomerase